MVDIGFHNINLNYLKEVQAKSQGDKALEKPLHFRLCFEIILHALTPSFIKREFGVKELDGQNLKKVDDPFFFQIAHEIWKLKDCDGFPKYIEKMKTRTKWQLYSELLFASFFFDQSEKIKFIQESGKKGKDFDLFVKNFKSSNGQLFENINLEVKSKESWFSSHNSLNSTLSRARKQMPKNELGAIGLIFENPPSASDKFQQADLDKGLARILSNTDRVLFVVYCWRENFETEKYPRATAIMYKAINKDGEIDSFIQPTFSEGSVNSFLSVK